MKKMLLITTVLLALTASAALAGGLNLNWGADCYTDAPSINKTFTCASNTGSAVMLASFAPTATTTDFLGVEAVIDGQTSLADIPAWWQFKNPGTCRTASLTSNVVYSPAAQNACLDGFGGGGSGGVSFYGVTGNRARIKFVWAMPSDGPLAHDAGQEYFAFNIKVDYAKTAPLATPACAGCLEPMSWVLNQVNSAGISGTEIITLPLANGCIMWQGGGNLCGATPTQNKTWGQVKSLYR